MLSIQSKLKMHDIMIGMFYAQLRFPTLLLWMGFISLNFLTQVLPLLVLGKMTMGLVLFGFCILRLALVMVFVVVFFAIIGFLTGSLKPHFLQQEYSFDGAIMTDKAGENESKTPLDALQLVYEDKKRFYLFKTGFKTEIISKRLMTESEIQQVRDFFKPKTGPISRIFYRAVGPLLLLLFAVTLWGATRSSYFMNTTTEPMKAYYQDDELALVICSNSMGHSESFLNGVLPFLGDSQPWGRKLFVETHFFDIKGGKLTQLTLTGHEPTSLKPVGQDLYLVSHERKAQHYLKFDGKQFTALTPQETQALQDPAGAPPATLWKAFKLWDENDQEVEGESPLKGDDDWASFPLKSGMVQIHYRSGAFDPLHLQTPKTYSLKGLAPNGAEQDLLAVKDGSRKIDRDLFEADFPPKAAQEGVGL